MENTNLPKQQQLWNQLQQIQSTPSDQIVYPFRTLKAVPPGYTADWVDGGAVRRTSLPVRMTMKQWIRNILDSTQPSSYSETLELETKS